MIYGAYTCWMRAACAFVPRRNFPPCRRIWPHFRQGRCRSSHKTRVSTTRQESNWRGFCPVQTVNNSSSSRPAHDVFIYLDFIFYDSFFNIDDCDMNARPMISAPISGPRQKRLRCRFKLNVLTFNFMLLMGHEQYNSSHFICSDENQDRRHRF
jgi:hypothetical protein